MEITSMSNRELYKTLTGYDYPHGAKNEDSTKNTEFVELNEPLNLPNSTDYTKRITIAPELVQEIKLDKGDKSITKLSDRFEYSGGKNNKTSANRSKYSNDIDFNDKYVQMVIYGRNFYELSSGIEGGDNL